GLSHRYCGDPEVELRCGLSHLLERAARAGIALVPENRHAPEPWHHFLDELNLLLAELRDLVRHARRVAAGPREASNQAGADGIGRHGHDDGDRLGGALYGFRAPHAV